MPKVKTSKIKYPNGWELIEPTLRELDAKMREGFIIYISLCVCVCGEEGEYSFTILGSDLGDCLTHWMIIIIVLSSSVFGVS